MIQAIKDELAAFPATYGALSDAEVADKLNLKEITSTKQYLSGSEIFNATDDGEYTALADDVSSTGNEKRAAWDRVCAVDSIDTSNGIARAREAELFGAGTTTRSNLQAARQSTISRAQELGIKVREGDVTAARAV